MRIGLIIYGRLDQTSGGYLYDRKVVEFLRKLGHRVDVISLPARNYLLYLVDNLSGQLLGKLAAQKFDLLLEDELNHPSLFFLNARLKKRITYPIVSIVHHLRSQEQHPALLMLLYRFVEKRYLLNVDAFIFNSFTTKKAVQGLVGGPGANVVAQPGGDRLRPRISSGQIRARAFRRGPLRIIFVGNFIRRKAPHLILEAMERLPRGSVEVVFVGGQVAEPGYARRLKEIVRRKKLQDQVKFLGQLREKQLAKQLRASHVLVVPSSYEGYGIAYLEGMGFGLPAIGTRAGAAGEIIKDGKDGFLIPVGDVGQLAARFKKLSENRALLAETSLAARRRYLRHPTWQINMERIGQFLSAYNNQVSSP